jgi:hypothetical protein
MGNSKKEKKKQKKKEINGLGKRSGPLGVPSLSLYFITTTAQKTV